MDDDQRHLPKDITKNKNRYCSSKWIITFVAIAIFITIPILYFYNKNIGYAINVLILLPLLLCLLMCVMLGHKKKNKPKD